LANKGTTSYLLKDYKTVNYLITCSPENAYTEQFINYITKLNDVSICFAIQEIKDQEKLNFEKLI
jgi:hypothetical protein